MFGAVIACTLLALPTPGLPPAFGQGVALNASQVSAIRISLRDGMAASPGNIGAATAIAQTVQQGIRSYGGNATMAIVFAVLYEARKHKELPCGVIGNGLAQAAADEQRTDPMVATMIASAVANDGTACEIAAFQAEIVARGFATLAAIAGSGGTPTGAIGGGLSTGGLGDVNSGGFPVSGGPGIGGRGCLNPSCTAM
jgi:hypothetical protein